MYHVTPATNLDAVMRDGLIPHMGLRSRQLGEAQPAVYLFPTINDVTNAVANWFGECFHDEIDLVLLFVQFDAATMKPTFQNDEHSWEWICSRRIDPSTIRIVPHLL